MAVQYIGTSISGLAADTKPTPSGNERGLIFVETDTNKIYQWDTDSWNATTPDDATTSVKGVASFSSDNFVVSAGAVSIKNDGVILGTETTGNYVGTITGGTGITSSGATSGEGIAHSLSLTAGLIADGSNITSVGALNAGSITSGFTSIDVGSGGITTTGTITAGDLSVTGTTTTVNSTNTTISDRLIELSSGASTGADSGIIIERGSTGDNAVIAWDESADTWTLGTTTATGSATGDLTITAGTLVANLTGNASGTAATVTDAAQPAIESVGTLTALTVDNVNIDGNTITATSGAVNITPAAGSAIVLDGTLNVDAGVVTGATSITSTAFVGALTGNADTVTGGVYTTGNQTIGGTKTFSSPISGDITGSAATTTGQAASVANGVYTTGNQTIGGAKTFSSDVVISYDGSPSLSFTDAASHSWKIGTKNADNNFYIIDGSSNDIAKFGTASVQLNKGLLVEGTNNAATRDNARFKSQRTTGNATYLRIARYGTGDDGSMYIGNNYNRNSGFAADNTSVGVSSIGFMTDGSLSLQTAAAGTAQPTAKLTISAAGLTTMTGGFSDTGTSYFGVDDTGVDVTFFGATAGRYMKWAGASGDNLLFSDNAAAYFGTGNDLQIYHDGGNSYIKDTGTGALFVFADTFRVRNAANSEDIVSMAQDGAVELYHNNVKKIETTATGATVTGALDIAGGELKLSVGQSTLRTDNAYIRKHASTGEINLDSQGGVRVNLDTNANNTDKTFSIGANASTSDVFSVSETGQVTIAGGGPGLDKVLTSDANGLATWEDAAGGGDSAAQIVVANGKTVTLGKPVVLNSDGEAEPLDHGYYEVGSHHLIAGTRASNGSMVGQGSEYASGYTPFQHVYDPVADAHVLFFRWYTQNGSTQTGNTQSYDGSNGPYNQWAGACVGKYNSGTWTWGPVQYFPDTPQGQTYGSNTGNEHRHIKATYMPLSNSIAVGWFGLTADDAMINQCRVTGSGSSIGLSWMKTIRLNTDCSSFNCIEIAGGTGSGPTGSQRVIVGYLDAADDLHFQVLMMAAFSASTTTDSVDTQGTDYEVVTQSVAYNFTGRNGMCTYNPSTHRVLMQYSSSLYNTFYNSAWIGDGSTANGTTGTSLWPTQGGSFTSGNDYYGWFYAMNWTNGYNGNKVGAFGQFVLLDASNEKWMTFGEFSNGAYQTFATFGMSGSSSGDPFVYNQQDAGTPSNGTHYGAWNAGAQSNYQTQTPGRYVKFKEAPADNPSDWKHPVNIDGPETLFQFMEYSTNNTSGNFMMYWGSWGWSMTHQDQNGNAFGIPTGIGNGQNNSNGPYTEDEFDASWGFGGFGSSSKWIMTADMARWKPTNLPFESYGFSAYTGDADSSFWFYDPDADKFFLFFVAIQPNDTHKSWNMGISVKTIGSGIGTATATTRGTGSQGSNGTYIGMAESTVTGNSGGTNLVNVLIPGSVISGMSGLLPGVTYFTDDQGDIYPRMPMKSLVNVRVGTALTTTSMKVEDSLEDSATNPTWPYQTTTTGRWSYNDP